MNIDRTQLTDDGAEMGRLAFDSNADGVFQLPNEKWLARCGRKMTKPCTKEEAQNALIDWKRGNGPEPWILIPERRADGSFVGLAPNNHPVKS